MMKPQSVDTSIEFEKTYIAFIRRASLSKKSSLVRSMTRTVLSNGFRAGRRTHSDLSEDQLQICYIEMAYGEDFAKGFAEYLEDRR